MTRVKTVIVGASTVGKTSLISSYFSRGLPTEYVPTVFDNFLGEIEVNGVRIALQIWDTAGNESLENIRLLSYTNTSVFLVCFSLALPASLEAVQQWWVPEVRRYVQHPAFVLVGLQSDLRAECLSNPDDLSRRGYEAVPRERGEEVSRAIHARGYVECCARTRENVDEVFNCALRSAQEAPPLPKPFSWKRALIKAFLG
jgi:small GTP-binding protein